MQILLWLGGGLVGELESNANLNSNCSWSWSWDWQKQKKNIGIGEGALDYITAAKMKIGYDGKKGIGNNWKWWKF